MSYPIGPPPRARLTIDAQIDEIVDRLIGGVRDETKRSRPWIRRPIGTWRPEQAAITWKREIRELIRSIAAVPMIRGSALTDSWYGAGPDDEPDGWLILKARL